MGVRVSLSVHRARSSIKRTDPPPSAPSPPFSWARRKTGECRSLFMRSALRPPPGAADIPPRWQRKVVKAVKPEFRSQYIVATTRAQAFTTLP